MRNLRQKFERFCYQNRTKGVPNLMLYIVLGSAIVYVMSMADKSATLYYALCFDRALILQGQIWRLFTYVFTYNAGSVLLTAVGLMCYFSLGRAVEHSWGTLRFNLFYLSGVVLMDLFCLIIGGNASVGYLNLSLLLAFATLYPDTRFLLFFIIPIKAWVLALFYFGLTVYDVIMYTLGGMFPFSLFPLVAIANYFLFFGRDVVRVFPLSWQVKLGKSAKKNTAYRPKSGPIPFSGTASYQSSASAAKTPYQHRCTVCGRTDVTHPDLEFRYCSRCSGYRCYCEDHINDHIHIE